jgi:hypothetical protein
LLHFLLAELRHVETRTLGHLTKIPAHVARAKTEPGFSSGSACRIEE